ncbi:MULTISPECIES: AraC family transcriptional regulator [Cohnella]|uniref:ABC-type Fe3+-hydroxamate transport system substrate-binding protein n=1 Tax=Cohnella phaseoli TaxID=456490 RepID=A0A3D9HU10_9BACL|nr:AraC family transcriptional regulator [Cohnella phaseoli]RED52994.1 ABC-type Fe3+-hydroxamate transport system substrate-binding protein [Cohnella phaseoli]
MSEQLSPGLPLFRELNDLWLKLVDIEWLAHGPLEPRLVGTHAILAIAQGEGDLTIGLQEFHASSHFVYFISPGQTIAARSDNGETFSFYLIHFRVRTENGSDGDFPASGELPAPSRAGSDTTAETLLRYWSGGEPLHRLRAQALFQEWLYRLLQPMPRNAVANSRLALERTKAYIDTHYHENLTIEQLARLAEISPKYYVDLFKKTYGLSTIDYVTETRLSQAKRLMAQSDMKLNEIARRVGYQDEFYFSRKFKQAIGLSPSAYAKSRQRKVAAYMSPVVGHLLALNLMPYAAPLHPKWTLHYYKTYRADIPLHLSAYRFNQDWEANLAVLTDSRPDAIVTLDHLHPGERERLEDIAPVLVLPSRETGWREQLRLTARFIGVESDAEAWLVQYERKLRRLGENIRQELGDESLLALSYYKGQFYSCPTRGMQELLCEELQLNLLKRTYNVPITAERIAELDADRILLNICQEPETLSFWQAHQATLLWQDLKATRQSKVHFVPSDPWREYSAHAVSRMADDLENRLCVNYPL